jgi:hypothetical protein
MTIMKHLILAAFLCFLVPANAMADTVKGYVDQVGVISEGSLTKLFVQLRATASKGSSPRTLCYFLAGSTETATVPASVGFGAISPMQSLLLAAMVATKEVQVTTTVAATNVCELTQVEMGRFPAASFLDPNWTYGGDITKYVQSVSASRSGVGLVLERHACGFNPSLSVRWADTPNSFAIILAAMFGGRKVRAVANVNITNFFVPCTIDSLQIQ